MTRLDIIHLRLPGEAAASLFDHIRESIGSGGEQTTEVTLYRRRGLDSDLAVHVRGSVLSPTEPDDLALQIASELKAWGLVEHSSWEEIPGNR